MMTIKTHLLCFTTIFFATVYYYFYSLVQSERWTSFQAPKTLNINETKSDVDREISESATDSLAREVAALRLELQKTNARSGKVEAPEQSRFGSTKCPGGRPIPQLHLQTCPTNHRAHWKLPPDVDRSLREDYRLRGIRFLQNPANCSAAFFIIPRDITNGFGACVRGFLLGPFFAALRIGKVLLDPGSFAFGGCTARTWKCYFEQISSCTSVTNTTLPIPAPDFEWKKLKVKTEATRVTKVRQ